MRTRKGQAFTGGNSYPAISKHLHISCQEHSSFSLCTRGPQELCAENRPVDDVDRGTEGNLPHSLSAPVSEAGVAFDVLEWQNSYHISQIIIAIALPLPLLSTQWYHYHGIMRYNASLYQNCMPSCTYVTKYCNT